MASRYRQETNSTRIFVTGSSASGDTILTSSFNEMSNSFTNNSYLGTDGSNTSPMGGLIYQMYKIQQDITDIHTEVSSSVYTSQVNSGSAISQIKTFGDRDATPSVVRGTLFKTSNGLSTAITAFDDGVEGQKITVLINDTNTDFTVDTARGVTNGLKLSGNASWTSCTTNDSITLVYNGSKWVETNRSDNT